MRVRGMHGVLRGWRHTLSQSLGPPILNGICQIDGMTPVRWKDHSFLRTVSFVSAP